MHTYGAKLRSKTTVYGGVPMDKAYTAGRFSRGAKPVPVETKPVGKYHCEFCGRGFDYAVALAGHKRSHK